MLPLPEHPTSAQSAQTQGPGRKPGASLNTRKRLSLSHSPCLSRPPRALHLLREQLCRQRERAAHAVAAQVEFESRS